MTYRAYQFQHQRVFLRFMSYAYEHYDKDLPYLKVLHLAGREFEGEYVLNDYLDHRPSDDPTKGPYIEFANEEAYGLFAMRFA